MFKNILEPKQIELLPLIHEFADNFYLVGGTAIALQIGHRKSIDFDLFCPNHLNKEFIRQVITDNKFIFNIIHEDSDQLHVIVNGVKLTFYQYPYSIQAEISFEEIISMPSLLSLGAMKVFAMDFHHDHYN